MSGIANAALTMPGRVVALASCSSERSVRICDISASSATTSPGTRIPGRVPRGIRQRYGPTRSSLTATVTREPLVGRRRPAATAGPREPDQRDTDADEARELGHAEAAEIEAVESQLLDGEAADGVEADVREEQPARARREARPEPEDEHPEDGEVPQRLVEERRVEIVERLEVHRARRARVPRDVELPGQVGRTPERLLVEEVPPAT